MSISQRQVGRILEDSQKRISAEMSKTSPDSYLECKTHQEIADEISTSRQNVQKILDDATKRIIAESGKKRKNNKNKELFLFRVYFKTRCGTFLTWLMVNP